MQKSFLTKTEIKALNLSPREVRQANGAHAEMLRNLSERKSHRKLKYRNSYNERPNSAANRQVASVVQFMADWKKSQAS